MKIYKNDKVYTLEDERGFKLAIELYDYALENGNVEQRINIVMDGKDSEYQTMLEDLNLVFDAPLQQLKRAITLIENNERMCKK